MIWIRCFFFGLVLWVYRRRLCEGAVGGVEVECSGGSMDTYADLFFLLLTELQKGEKKQGK